FRGTHLLFRGTHLLFRGTHLLFRGTHLLFRGTHLLFRRVHNAPYETTRIKTYDTVAPKKREALNLTPLPL
ncbi:MAG: hypothetical protein V7K41_01235, partial [Nostoc sp.]|uniref:hypothetical protein n=1 Tax=Nostoc sp. TaxID=1180 RepID=UPI002FFC3D79